MENERSSRGTPGADPAAGPGSAAASGPGGQADNEKPRSRRWRVVIPLLLLLVIIGGGGGYWYLKHHGIVSTDDAFIDGDKVSLSARILGRIDSLTVDEGDTVRLGQLLVKLDDHDLLAQEAQARANLEYARQSVTLAQVEVQSARDDYERATVQFRGNVIPQERYDHAKTALDQAEARYNIALAHVGTATAQLQVVEAQLDNTRITAPIAGVVAKRWALTGDVVQPGQPIFAIYNLSNVWVTANFEETKLGSIHPGDPVDITVDAYPGHRFGGEVLLIVAAAASEFSLIPPNNASGNFTKVTQRVPVRISVHSVDDGPAPTLRPGMSVLVKVREKKD
jgi:membrane fusion protein (multidrug efflux system)